MRLVLFALVAALLAEPTAAQQLSPLTGTTSTPPTAPVQSTPRARRTAFQERFDAANTTHDGKLTLEQARAGHMPQVVRHFDAIDSSHKGYVTVADIVAYRRAARAARRAAKP